MNTTMTIVRLERFIDPAIIDVLPSPSMVENVDFDDRLIRCHFYATAIGDWYLYAGHAVPIYYSKTYDAFIKNDYRFFGIAKLDSVIAGCFYLSELNLLRHPLTNQELVIWDRRWVPKSIGKLDLSSE